MKKLAFFFVIFVSIAFFSCSNLESNNSESEYGSLTVTGGLSRALYTGEISSVSATISGYGIANISGTMDNYKDGKGSVRFENIPIGKNRVVTIQALDSTSKKITDVFLTNVVNILSGENTLSEVNWLTSVKGNLYKAAIEAEKDVTNSEISAKLDGIAQKITNAKMHASLIDAQKIIRQLDMISADEISISDYKKTTSEISITCYGVEGKSIFIADPYSEMATAPSDGSILKITDVLTGYWSVYTKDGTTIIKVGSINVTSTNGVYTVGEKPIQADRDPVLPRYEPVSTEVTDRIIVHVPTSLGYQYIWAWASETVNYTGGSWPGEKMTDSDGDGYYDYTIKNGSAYVTSSSVLFNANKDGSTAGNGQTKDLSITSPGEYWYIGGQMGSGAPSDWRKEDAEDHGPSISLSKADGATFDGSTFSVVITAKNCTVAKYTTDGSQPYSSATAVSFSDTKTLTLGSGLSVGDKVTLRVYVDNGNAYTDISATYEKIEKSSAPTRLGAYYTSKSTSFSIWSPDSSNVTVTVTPKGGTAKDYTCTKGFAVNGDYPDAANIYGVTVTGDLHLAEYQFKISGKAVRDPYGVMISSDNKNIVLDLSKTNPDGGWAERPALANREDAIIYEVHIRDFTIDENSGVDADKKGKFPGMVQTGTTYGGIKTGIDHLKELGITHVQILPMYDFATEMYNWGYDPKNYNIPEDQYSTCPNDYVNRIKEVKTMINEFHKNGIRVVMDVVYNHTYDKEMFKDITTKYYTAGDLSGCGNSTNTGTPMFSRFVRDSLEYWVDEYNIDGFRFDLIGIFHRDAVKEWGEYLNVQRFPERNLLMYGEPWNGYATDTEESRRVRYGTTAGMASGHVGVFNGAYREQIKGDNDGKKLAYMANGDIGWGGAIAGGMRGSILATKSTADLPNMWDSLFCYDPEQSINYISAHDNYCLWDKIVYSGKTGDYAKRIDKFGMGIVITSQGIPFIHAGDEFLRSKAPGGDWKYAHNSYNASDNYNKIRWADKQTNTDVFNYYKDLIALRKATPGMRLTTWEEINSRMTTKVKYADAAGIHCQNDTSLPDKVVVSIIDDNLAIVYNPGNNFTVSLPSGSWTKVFDINGTVNDESSKVCEGTAVTVFKKN